MASMLDVLERLEAAAIDIDQNRCVRVRNRNAKCRNCADSCVSGCISYSDNQLSVEPEKCIGCGTCASACPTDALRPKKPTDAQLYDACLQAGKRTEARVVVACDEVLARAAGLYDVDKVAAVACLGRVDLSLLVRLIADGATGVTLVRGICAECPSARGIEICERVVDSANILFDTWNCSTSVKISAKLPGFTRVADDIGYEQGKRAFLFSVGSDAKNVLEAVASSALEDALPKCDEEPTRFAHVDETGVLPHGTSTRRQVLMTALNQLETRNGSPKDEMVDVLTWSEVVIDKALCNSCRMCATFCPTGANFKLEDENGVLGIGHRVRLCANCRLCSDICPTGALSLSEEVFAVDVAGDVIERFEMGKTLERSSTNRDAILEKTRAQLKNDGARVTLA